MTAAASTGRASWGKSLLSSGFWLRTAGFAALAYLVFFVLSQPMYIRGPGMEPTYRAGSLNLCWRGRFWFSDPRPYQVVSVRLPGTKAALVRRVIASEGDLVSFLRGRLTVNDKPVEEAYVRQPCTWTMRPVRVSTGHVFVAGDNRTMPLHEAMIGEVPVKHILGAPLW